MSFSFIKKLPTPEDIRNEYPVDSAIQTLKEKRDQEICDVFTGKSDKFLAISVPALQIMRMLCATICCACVKSRIRFQTRF